MALGEESAEACFDRALAALGGDVVDFSAFECRKLFNIIATPSGADVRITPSGLRVLYARSKGWFSYFPALGPPLVSALRELATPGAVSSPFVAQPEAMRSAGLFAIPGARKFWVTATVSEIQVACRASDSGSSFDQDPSPLLPWTLPPIVYGNFQPPLACPHCLASLSRARLADGAVICGSCGRSHRASAEHLASAKLDTIPSNR